MSQHDDFDRSLARWFEAEPRPAGTAEVLDGALRATGRRRPRPGLFAAFGSRWVGDSVDPTADVGTPGRTGIRFSTALLLLLLALVLVAGAVLVGARLRQPAPVDLGIFAPVAGQIVYGDERGIWGDDPDGKDVKLAAGAGEPLAWSRDGTQLLVGGEHLFILHADGSETQLTTDSLGPGDATFSPDGSHVVFEGSDGLYAVDSGGGPAELLVEGLGGDWSLSPDGAQIAYLVGSGDGNHRVWVMDAAGNDKRQIMANHVTLGAGHPHGLAWSPAGDRIALGIEGIIYTFAPDGSGFTAALRIGGRRQPFWSPDGSQVETSGPWHPGITDIDEPTTSPS